MKTFSEGFFDVSNFMKKKEVFAYASPSDNRPILHVCYNVNDPFFRIMGVSAVSVLENNADMAVSFHIFSDGYSPENADKVKQLAEKWQCNCTIYLLDMTPFEDFHIKVQRFSRITYARICMPMVLQSLAERFLYIDADALCIGSLKPLLELDMTGKAMAAVSETPPSVTKRAGYLKLSSGKYFNDGIMLVNIPEWRRQRIMEQAFSYQNENPKRFLGQSQDVLNLVFDGKNYFLPAVYNLYGGDTDRDDGVIIHWTGRRKPWQMVLTHFDELWRHYLDISPWDSITNILPIKEPENYHDFQQWGRFQKKKGNLAGYYKGLFWYVWLRLRYKCNF